MSQQHSRRRFLQQLGLAGLSIPLISANNSCNEQQSKQRTMQQNKEGKLRIALVGLGGYAGGQLAPALQKNGTLLPGRYCYRNALQNSGLERKI